MATVSQPLTIEGIMADYPNVAVSLWGFEGLQEIELGNAVTDQSGAFSISYPSSYQGMGMLHFLNKGSLSLVLLPKEQLVIHGQTVQELNELQIENSNENKAWFSFQKERKQQTAFSQEIYNQLKQDHPHLYSSQVIMLYALLEQQQQLLKQFNESEFRSYTDKVKDQNLRNSSTWNSGLLGLLLESHFSLLKTQNKTKEYLDDIEYFLSHFRAAPQKLTAVSEFLFNYLEKYNDQSAASFLSNWMLDQEGCSLDVQLERRFEQYRVMKEGNPAPEIIFFTNENTVQRGFKTKVNRLSEIKSNYKLIVFWASWCSYCTEEMPKLEKYYPILKKKGIEVVSLSLDTDKNAFLLKSLPFPWYSYCDFKKWESQAVYDYYVFSTPTFYLLDQNNVILKKVKNVAHLEAFVDTYF